MNMNSVLQKALWVGALSMASGLAAASSMPTGTVNVYGGMATQTVSTVEVQGYDTDPSYYELVVGAYDALTTFTFDDTTPDGKTVTYNIYADDDSVVGQYSQGALLVTPTFPISIVDGVGGAFSVLLSANTQYVLEMFTNGATASTTNISAVPLPGAALLFGTALLGAGYLRRRNQSGMAAAA